MTDLIWVALITGGLGLIGSLVSGFFHVKASRAKKLGNNPHPCAAHEKWLKELDDKIDEQGKEMSKFGQSMIDTNRRLVRIEGMLNGTYRK